jgi:RNA polymerase sigma-70 factor (ECF subfamily)
MAANRIQIPARAPTAVRAIDGDHDGDWALDQSGRSGRVATAVGRQDAAAHDFRRLYDSWFADVARWVRALGASPSDQDDLVQEVFVVVHRRLHAFDGQNMAGWLYRIAAHQVRDFRRLRWIRHIFGRSVPLSPGVPSTGPTPLMMLETKEKQLLLERLLSNLNEAQRAAFVLFEMDGYTGDEIARIQQVSINTVRARIHRARKKVTGLLLKWREGPRGGLE